MCNQPVVCCKWNVPPTTYRKLRNFEKDLMNNKTSEIRISYRSIALEDLLLPYENLNHSREFIFL